MIQQQIQSDEDDDVSDDENTDDIIDTNAEDQTSVDTPRTVLGSTVEWHVVSVKPDGVKAADHKQYVD